jgi:hypothetical protein
VMLINTISNSDAQRYLNLEEPQVTQSTPD